MTLKFSDIKARNTKFEKGGWVTELPNLEGIAVKVRGIGNSDYRRILVQLRSKATKEQLEDEDFMDDLLAEVAARTLLLDWDGVTEEDDKTPIPCTPAMALKVMTDVEMGIFRAAVEWAAMNVATRGVESLEQDSKNSELSSTGT